MRYVFLVFLAITAPARAADWPHLLGPTRDGVSSEQGLATTWPKDGPARLWAKKVGEGYSGPVVAGDKVIVFHRVGDEDIVACWDAATGKEQWTFAYPTRYRDALGKGDGPRATPAIAGEHVVALGAEGKLHCLNLKDGAKIWSRDLAKDYQIPDSYFGVGASPLVEKNLVLVNVGGKNAGIVALSLAEGQEVWKATNDQASYSSPTVATVDKQRLAFFFTRTGVVILEPETGKVKHQQRWRARIDASVNAAVPLVLGDRVFYSSSYETGALLLKVKNNGAEELWNSDDVMSNHYNTCVHHEGHLYGIHGRQEGKSASLRCVDLETQKVKWEQRRFGCASLILVQGHLLILTEDGDLVLAEATPRRYEEKGKARILDSGPCRAHPALSQGRLFVRDQGTLGCFDLKK
jgi:outer membrane protein assembly factor BamB